MQDTAAKPASAVVELKDGRLFREACSLDGQWVQAKSGAMINVDSPATGEIIGRVPKLGSVETKQAIGCLPSVLEGRTFDSLCWSRLRESQVH